MVSLYSVLTVIAVIWVIILLACMIGGDEFAALFAVLMTIASVGLLLYRFGELVKFFVGAE